MQMFQQRSPMAMLSTKSIEESLRCSKISVTDCGRQSDANEENLNELCLKERDSCTLEGRVESLKFTETKTKQRL